MAADTDRRHFLTTLGVAAGSAVLGLSKAGCATSPPAETIDRPSHLVRFGHTDLWVSRLCQGTAFRTHLSRRGDSKEAHDFLRYCIDVGINFFDTAEAYGSGESEIALGHGIAGRRHEVVISTKAYPRVDGERIALTESILRTRVEGSLKRLGTDYIDLYFIHGPDRKTPSFHEEEPDREAPTRAHMEEIAAAMTALVESGKIRYWGVSNHLPRQVEELMEAGNQPGRLPLAGLQDYLTVVAGDRLSLMVDGMFPLIRQGNLGLMAFSPLGGGSLVPGREDRQTSAVRDVVTVLDEGGWRAGRDPSPGLRRLGRRPFRGRQRPLRRRETGARRGKSQGDPVGPAGLGHGPAQRRGRNLRGPNERGEGGPLARL